MQEQQKETEVWKVIPKFQRYMVSNLSRVMNSKRGNMMTPSPNNKRYLMVTLSNNGRQASKCVHILVAEAFLENPEHLPEVDHIDGDPKNNRVSNLRWCTSSQNKANRKGWGKSKCKGVCWDKKAGKLKSQIQVAGINYHLGYYESEAEASCVYDWFALLLYKTFAKLNTKFKKDYPQALLKKIFALMYHHNLTF